MNYLSNHVRGVGKKRKVENFRVEKERSYIRNSPSSHACEYMLSSRKRTLARTGFQHKKELNYLE